MVLNVNEHCAVEKPVDIGWTLKEGRNVALERHWAPILDVHVWRALNAHLRLCINDENAVRVITCSFERCVILSKVFHSANRRLTASGEA